MQLTFLSDFFSRLKIRINDEILTFIQIRERKRCLKTVSVRNFLLKTTLNWQIQMFLFLIHLEPQFAENHHFWKRSTNVNILPKEKLSIDIYFNASKLMECV
jgi:hypothetical protein